MKHVISLGALALVALLGSQTPSQASDAAAALTPESPLELDSTSLRHPHVPKMVQVRLGRRGPTVTLRYQTATFDEKGAAAMPSGGVWHLAGATLETDAELVVGGRTLKAARYNLVARKVIQESEDDTPAKIRWELILAEGRGFSRDLGETHYVLITRFEGKAPMEHHLNLDLHPSESEGLELVVRFDRLRATASVAVPEAKKR